MHLVVPVLRLSMLFLNVFETFKTLKRPPPSKRNGGQPSVRALAQRKRNMKGCLAVWIVWCCFAVYERTLDSIVGMFIPFYTEVKSIALLFLLITRARGAEPIYLHVLRPLIKPHATTLDSLLDFTNVFGEFLLIFLTLPIRLVLSWWRRPSSHDEDLIDFRDSSSICTTVNLEASEMSRSGSYSVTSESMFYSHPGGRSRPNGLGIPPDGNGRRFGTARYPSADVSGGTMRSRRQAQVVDAQLRHASDPNPQRAHSIPEIWYPPASAYDVDDPIIQTSTTSSVHTPPNISPDPSPSQLTETEAVDEWRLYPPFPSAYPPTPLPASSKLPSSPIVAPKPRRPSESIHFPPIPEAQEQGFPSSLPPLHEPLNPDSSASSSDDDRIPGVQNCDFPYIHNHTLVPVDIENNGDEEDEDEDDAFDVTLRTPLAPLGSSRSRIRAVPSPLVSSVPTSPTALTTFDDGSSLRTRTTSESSASLSLSDSSSVAGQKRTLPLTGVVDAHSRAGAFERSMPLQTTDIPWRSKSTPRPTGVSGLTTDVSTSVASDSVDEDEEDDDSDSDGASQRAQIGIKRRRVLDPLDGPSQRLTRNSTTSKKELAKRKLKESKPPARPLVPSRTSSRLANSRSGSTAPPGSRRTAYIAPPTDSSVTEKSATTKSMRGRK